MCNDVMVVNVEDETRSIVYVDDCNVNDEVRGIHS